MPSPSVFMSYSHDSDDHKAWVIRLATDLRSAGVDVKLDTWHLRPGEAAGPFMARAVESSTKVIVICSTRYVDKTLEQKGGAGYEGALVTAELIADQGTARFIPVLRGNPEGAVPSFLRGRIYVDLREDERYEDRFTTLLRAIHDLPAADPPPIGESLLAAAGGLTQPPLAPPANAIRQDGASLAEQVEQLLQEPIKRITLSKQIWSITEAARSRLQTGLYEYAGRPSPETVLSKVTLVDRALRDLTPPFSVMGRWASSEQIPPVANALVHLLDVPEPSGPFYPENRHIARYPALKALYAVGVGALVGDRLAELRLLLTATVPANERQDKDLPLVAALHRGFPFSQQFWKMLPGKEGRATPLSEHVEHSLADELPGLFNSDAHRVRLFDRLEGIIALAYVDAVFNPSEGGWIPIGAFSWRKPNIFRNFAEELEKEGTQSSLIQAGFFGGSVDRAAQVISQTNESLIMIRHQAGIF